MYLSRGVSSKFVVPAIRSAPAQGLSFRSRHRLASPALLSSCSIVTATGLVLLQLMSCSKPAPPQPPDNVIDTTSHAFRWEIDTIGAEGSYLYDVMILDDTCAYAVGMMYPRDSTGKSNLNDPYNAARWDGEKWTMIKVPYMYQGHAIYNPIHSVFGFGKRDIWFAGNGVEYWNGDNFFNDDAINSVWPSQLMNKIWGSSDNDLYIVGDGGAAAHFDGTWHRLTSNTSLPFQDIWGSIPTQGQEEVIAVASDKYGLGGKYLASISDDRLTVLPDSVDAAVSLSGIWFVAGKKYYLVGDGVYEKQTSIEAVWQLDPITRLLHEYPYAVRGTNTNDVIIACDGGLIAHYNGSTWEAFSQISNPIDHLRNVSFTKDLVMAVGSRNYDGIHYYGVVYRGMR